MPVYLIHFKESISPDKKCQHYIGFANDVEARISYHRKGRSKVRLFEVAKERGITFEVVRIWPDGDRDFERKLKKRKNHKKLCPICTPQKAKDISE